MKRGKILGTTQLLRCQAIPKATDSLLHTMTAEHVTRAACALFNAALADWVRCLLMGPTTPAHGVLQPARPAGIQA